VHSRAPNTPALQAMGLVTSIPEPISAISVKSTYFTYLSIVCEGNACDLCCQKDDVQGTSLHEIPFFEDDRPEAKRRRKKRVGFVEQKRAKTAVAIEALGDMFRALQTRGF